MDMQEEISALAILIQDLRKHKKYLSLIHI